MSHRDGAAVGRGGRDAARGAVVRAARSRSGPVDLQLDRRDRVAVTGPNGGGKSTLLGALLGRLPPTPGDRRLGSGRASSARSTRRAGCSWATSRWSTPSPREVPDWPTADVRTLLAKFGLGADHVGRPAASLSPGERTRAALALLQARGVEPARPRRADQPPRPAGDRAARGGARHLRRHVPARHARPSDARDRPAHPPLGGRRRRGHGDPPGLRSTTVKSGRPAARCAANRCRVYATRVCPDARGTGLLGRGGSSGERGRAG